MAAIFLILGLFGGYAHWRYDRRSFWFFGPLIFTVTIGLIVYLNFKYGYSESPELGDTVAREVRDRDYFYLWSFSAWSVWVALGFVFLWESVAAVFGTEMVGPARSATEQPTKRSWLFASPLLALVFIPLFVNWKSASRAGQTETRDFAADLLNSVEPYGVLVTVGDNDTFPLWYAQEVEGHTKGRRHRQYLPAQHGLVYAADAAAPGVSLRFLGRSGRLSWARMEATDDPGHEHDDGSGGCRPIGGRAVGPSNGAQARYRLHSGYRSEEPAASVSRAGRYLRAPPHRGQS